MSNDEPSVKNHNTLSSEEINLKIVEHSEKIELKLDNKMTEFQRKIFEEQAKIFKERVEFYKFLLPTAVAISLGVGGLQLYSKAQLDEFKKEILGQTNEQPILSLFGINTKPLDDQTVQVAKVLVFHRADNGAVLARKQYSYRISILMKKIGKGQIKSGNTVSYFYNTVSEPDNSATDDPSFNNFNEVNLGDQNSLIKINAEKLIPYTFSTTTFEKPSPGKLSKVKYKIFYGDREVSSTFNIKFIDDLKFQDFDIP